MSQTNSKIVGLIFFLIIVSALFFAALMPVKQQVGKHVKSINISGNHLLPQVSYLKFAKLNNTQNLVEITLPFSGVHPIVKFGRNNIPQKIWSLNSIWDEIKNADNDLSQSDYVDLRFTNQIYL